MPSSVMVVVMMMVVALDAAAHLISTRHCHSRSSECDYRKCGDEFHLVHCSVPFFATRKPILALTPC